MSERRAWRQERGEEMTGEAVVRNRDLDRGWGSKSVGA